MPSDRCELLCLDLSKAEALRTHRLERGPAVNAALKAGALADPTRLMLAAAIGEAEELCVCDLSWIAERAENLVSHHLRQLRVAGLASSRRNGKMVLYSLTPLGQAMLRVVLEGDAARAPA